MARSIEYFVIRCWALTVKDWASSGVTARSSACVRSLRTLSATCSLVLRKVSVVFILHILPDGCDRGGDVVGHGPDARQVSVKVVLALAGGFASLATIGWAPLTPAVGAVGMVP